MHSPSLVISRPHPKWIFSVVWHSIFAFRTEAMVSERNAARTERGLGKSIPPKITAALSFWISLCPMQLYLSNLKDKKSLHLNADFASFFLPSQQPTIFISIVAWGAVRLTVSDVCASKAPLSFNPQKYKWNYSYDVQRNWGSFDLSPWYVTIPFAYIGLFWGYPNLPTTLYVNHQNSHHALRFAKSGSAHTLAFWIWDERFDIWRRGMGWDPWSHLNSKPPIERMIDDALGLWCVTKKINCNSPWCNGYHL